MSYPRSVSYPGISFSRAELFFNVKKGITLGYPRISHQTGTSNLNLNALATEITLRLSSVADTDSSPKRCFLMMQVVWYRRNGTAIQGQKKRLHSAQRPQHICNSSQVKYWGSRACTAWLPVNIIHGPPSSQLQLFKGAESTQAGTWSGLPNWSLLLPAMTRVQPAG